MITLADHKTKRIYGNIETLYPYLRYFTTLHNIDNIKIRRNQNDTSIGIKQDGTFTLLPHLVEDLSKDRHRFSYLNVTIEIHSRLDHANTVIVDRQEKVVFLFDPYGYETSMKSIHNQNLLLDIIQKELVNKLEGFRLVSNLVEYKDIPGPQRIQKKLKRGGFCLMWGLMLVCLRIQNPDLTYEGLLRLILNPHSITYKDKRDQACRLLELIQKYTAHVNESVHR